MKRIKDKDPHTPAAVVLRRDAGFLAGPGHWLLFLSYLSRVYLHYNDNVIKISTRRYPKKSVSCILFPTPTGINSEAVPVVIRGINGTTICGSQCSRARYDPRRDPGPELRSCLTLPSSEWAGGERPSSP